MKNVGIIIGSLRKGAFTRLLAQSLQELAPPSLHFSEIGIGELPFYNQDLETDAPPAQWSAFREQVKKSDAIVFVTPEYNRGVPAVVKNAIDVGSRPRETSVWRGKPALVISLTPGTLGAMAAHQQLRLGLSVIGVSVMPFPELYLSGAVKLFDPSGKLIAEDTRKLLTSTLADFDTWIGRHK